MPYYCVNQNPQEGGEHEVHDLASAYDCLPDPSNRIELGWHTDCKGAIRKAKEYYNIVDGCYYCCKECHTR